MRSGVYALACVIMCLCQTGAGQPRTESAPLQIPFRWTPGQIEIQVSIDGRAPLWFILDSGAEFSMLDEETARSLAIARGETVTLTIGRLTMRGQTLRLWRLDNFRRQKREIRGVLGCELFERYVVTIDYQKQIVVLTEPAAFRPGGAARVFPITFAGRLPVIRGTLQFEGKVLPSRLMIDTGASHAVTLRYPYASEHRLFGPRDRTTTSETVAAGPTPFVTLRAEELRIGPWTFRSPAVEAYGSARGAGGYTATDGLLGNDILRHFRVTFDYSRKRVFLEKVATER